MLLHRLGTKSKYLVLRKKNCLHPVCHVAVRLLWFSWPVLYIVTGGGKDGGGLSCPPIDISGYATAHGYYSVSFCFYELLYDIPDVIK